MHDPNSAGGADAFADLRSQWQQLVGDEAVLDGVIRRHRERHRRYHTLDHVVAVVRHVGDLSAVEVVGDIGSVVAAAWFHDAVYEPRSPANERASARLAKRDLSKLGWTEERCGVVAAMIEGTAGHETPRDIDTAVLFDADLAILGAAPADYAVYVAGVRAEYAHVDDDSWQAGRAEVLRSFLDLERIYATPTGVDRWESAARTNLIAELEGLRR